MATRSRAKHANRHLSDRQLFAAVKKAFVKALSWTTPAKGVRALQSTHLSRCRSIEEARRKAGKDNRRYFAHMGCRLDTICVARAFSELPDAFRAGILLHELGHVAAVSQGYTSEMMADAIVSWHLGIEIAYKGKLTLECISNRDLQNILKG